MLDPLRHVHDILRQLTKNWMPYRIFSVLGLVDGLYGGFMSVDKCLARLLRSVTCRLTLYSATGR